LEGAADAREAAWTRIISDVVGCRPVFSSAQPLAGAINNNSNKPQLGLATIDGSSPHMFIL
jgi:hypothetical protein